MQIYLVDGDVEVGPFSADEVRRQIAAKKYSADSLASDSERREWRALRDVLPDSFSKPLRAAAPLPPTTETAAEFGPRWLDYVSGGLLLLAALLLWPFCLIVLWVLKRFTKRTKIWLTFAIVTVGIAANPPGRTRQWGVSSTAPATTKVTRTFPFDVVRKGRGEAGYMIWITSSGPRTGEERAQLVLQVGKQLRTKGQTGSFAVVLAIDPGLTGNIPGEPHGLYVARASYSQADDSWAVFASTSDSSPEAIETLHFIYDSARNSPVKDIPEFKRRISLRFHLSEEAASTRYWQAIRLGTPDRRYY